MLGGKPPYDKETAVYVITSKTVYLPDGTQLEAHSGLGSKMDDPKFSHVRMQGVTPPHIYALKPRESLFHGVPALRLTPL
ncbi:tlde1 domain-containing protein, partial [Acinetobacter baumannii]